MLCALTVSVLLLLVSSSHAFLEDFSDKNDGYEYVFHGDHNLFLVIHENKCYFFPVKEGTQYYTLNALAKTHTENFVRSVIEKNEQNTVKASNLDDMRTAFGDILADFRCVDNDIFYVDLSQYHVSTPKPHTGLNWWNPFSFFSPHHFGK